jgi:hypothetical protein
LDKISPSHTLCCQVKCLMTVGGDHSDDNHRYDTENYYGNSGNGDWKQT